VQVEVLGFRVGAPLGAPCTSYAVSGDSALLLLDCGPGALERLWERRLAERLDAIEGLRLTLISHAAGADLLVLEATYVDAGPELARDGHMNGEQAGEVAQRAGARRLLLTHIGPWAERNAENLRRARERFPATNGV
jgi:ribonuclease BN (tRNA processing enzyme)